MSDVGGWYGEVGVNVGGGGEKGKGVGVHLRVLIRMEEQRHPPVAGLELGRESGAVRVEDFVMRAGRLRLVAVGT